MTLNSAIIFYLYIFVTFANTAVNWKKHIIFTIGQIDNYRIADIIVILKEVANARLGEIKNGRK